MEYSERQVGRHYHGQSTVRGLHIARPPEGGPSLVSVQALIRVIGS